MAWEVSDRPLTLMTGINLRPVHMGFIVNGVITGSFFLHVIMFTSWFCSTKAVCIYLPPAMCRFSKRLHAEPGSCVV